MIELLKSKLLLLTYNIKKYSNSTTSNYVGKIHVFNYWSENCGELKKMYSKGKVIVLLDREPLVKISKVNGVITPRLVRFDYNDIEKKLKEYGLRIENDNTVLLDVLSPTKIGYDYKPLIGVSIPLIKPEPTSGINFNENKKALAKDLGGQCISLIGCILTMISQIERNYLAKFQSTIQWHKTYKLCPCCGGRLIKKLAKTSATCENCLKIFYPTIHPVSMTIITDETNEYCLLVNHLDSIKGMFTVISGHANPGESLKECARRGIAEEIGLECSNLLIINASQPWPIHESSLIIPFCGVIKMTSKMDIAVNKIECARWFSRKEILEAIKRTDDDPFLKNLPSLIAKDLEEDKNFDVESKLYYVPPPGTLASMLIRAWAEKPKGLLGDAN
uniref:Nudix hydrolase domain-containing protein n=1 Tax=Strongyloides venezuelensis TaxID=75913 RepID=A0A0K0FQU3_STRVS